MIGSQLRFENRKQSERDDHRKTENSPIFADEMKNFGFATYDIDKKGVLGEKAA